MYPYQPDTKVKTMNATNPQQEMQQIIQSCINSQDFTTAQKCLEIYINTFGKDSYAESWQLALLYQKAPLVSLICIINNAAEQTFPGISEQKYSNLDITYISLSNLEEEFFDYIYSSNSKYICFYEAGHEHNIYKILLMVHAAEEQPDLNGIICARNFITSDGTLISHPDYFYQESLDHKVFHGKDLLEYCIENNVNLYGNLSTLLLSTEYVKQICPIRLNAASSMRPMDLLYQLLLPATIGCLYQPLVSTILAPNVNDSNLQSDYEDYIQTLQKKGLIQHTAPSVQNFHIPSDKIVCERDITFFYTDKGEYYNLEPLAEEAKRRGYKVCFTENLTQKAKIGVYCQHICYPENAEFSVILLHDLAQGHNRWPNLWETVERWNKFDIGILPGKAWAERWSQCACQYYANPRHGVYELGYPKSDLINSEELKQRASEIRKKLNLKYDTSVLYAPSWENDGKEDDFITSLSSLNVNLLIKQAHWSAEYPSIIQNIQQMRSLHEGKYENVYYIEPSESILTALTLCDMVVSDESSVMAEALMFGKPSIAVTDWLIPDTIPSRYASVPMDYVIKCQKNQLQEYVIDLLQSPEKFKSCLDNGKSVFSNSGNVCRDILDAIEYYTSPEPKHKDYPFLEKRLSSTYALCSMWN